MARVHAVQVPPRPGLALKLRQYSVYAPLQRDPCREVFTTAFLEMVASFDMQVPRLLMGDFNGTDSPEGDFSTPEEERHVWFMLSRLLGPGGAFLDLQLVVSPSNFAFIFRASNKGVLHFSRPDFVLGNRAVFSLISRVFVASGEMEIWAFPRAR